DRRTQPKRARPGGEHSKAAVASAAVRVPPPALGSAAEAGAVEVAPAANGPTAVGHMEPVLTPFPDIAEHVLESPRVPGLRPDGMRPFFGVGVIPANVQRRTMTWRGAPRPASVFPLGFRRQPILPVAREQTRLAVEGVEFAAVLIRRLPAHRIHRG